MESPKKGTFRSKVSLPLFGKILHNSPWKLSIEELVACITYMVGNQMTESSVIDYIEFARVIKQKHNDCKNLAELRSIDDYYSRIHLRSCSGF